MLRLKLHVTPKSGRDEVVGWRGDELQVRVTAPPEDGKANAAVCKTVAAALGVPKSAVRVMRGDTSRHKLIEIEGASEADSAAAFGKPDESLF
ncbi:MAG TPA: DUF167 domain-containing protein [Coriobacteriia bacterium]|nr:DUF167 domain-containing protein [Coriobacteriia bacterium]